MVKKLFFFFYELFAFDDIKAGASSATPPGFRIRRISANVAVRTSSDRFRFRVAKPTVASS